MNLLEDIKSKTAEELQAALKEWGLPAFRSRQIFRWLQQGVCSFEDMTNLPRELRERLAERFYIAGAQVADVYKRQVLDQAPLLSDEGIRLVFWLKQRYF